MLIRIYDFTNICSNTGTSITGSLSGQSDDDDDDDDDNDDDDDDDDDDNDNDNDDDNDNDNDNNGNDDDDDDIHPLPNETQREYYLRTSLYWSKIVADNWKREQFESGVNADNHNDDDNDNDNYIPTELSEKDCKKEGFQLAAQRYNQAIQSSTQQIDDIYANGKEKHKSRGNDNDKDRVKDKSKGGDGIPLGEKKKKKK